MHHQISASAHANGAIESLLNKDNSPLTCANEDSSIEAHTKHIFFKIQSHNIVYIIVTYALAIGFN